MTTKLAITGIVFGSLGLLVSPFYTFWAQKFLADDVTGAVAGWIFGGLSATCLLGSFAWLFEGGRK